MSTDGADPRYVELKNLPVDTRGHHQIHNPDALGRLNGTHLDASIHRIDPDEPLTKGFASVYRRVFSCATCDAHPGFTVVENPEGPLGVGLRAKTECVLPNGADSVFTLTVASKRLIVADDLRPVFDLDLPRIPGYNSAAGQMLYTQTMAAIGCATGVAVNYGPDLVSLGDEHYAIALHDDEWPAGHEHSGGHLSDLGYPDAKVLAHISGAVASYAMADYDTWASRATDKGLDPEALLADESQNAVVIDFPNGIYLFVNHTGRTDVEPDGACPLIFTSITKISPLLPPRRRGEAP